jgi:hypothetical protein
MCLPASGERWLNVTVLHLTDVIRIDTALPSRSTPPVAAPAFGHSLRDLQIAAANQLELWAAGHPCTAFRREYLTDLVADLRASSLDVLANQLDLWSAGKVCDEERRGSVLALVAELRSTAA